MEGYMIWLPQPLYNAKPVVFLLAALVLVLMSQNRIAALLAVALTGYAVWIFFMRYIWRTSRSIE